MPKKFQLQIPEPCHEDWNKMTPGDKGRFCGSCQKTVMDFTGMSDAQLVAFFKKPSTGSVCGRFMHDQLDRNIAIPRKRIPWLRYFFQFAIPVFLTSLKSSAQGNVVLKEKISIISSLSETLGLIAVSDDPTKVTIAAKAIKGRVVDEKGIGIPYAAITIKGTKVGVISGKSGLFSIKPNSAWQQVTLISSCIGFTNREITINQDQFSDSLIVNMSLRSESLGGLVIVTKCFAPKKRKPVEIIKQVFKDTAFKFFKAYPNPVASGSSIKIELKKAKAGEYQLDLLTLNGQAVYSSILNFESEGQVNTINIPSVAAGTYFIRMTNKESGKQHTEKIIVQ